MIKTMQDRQPGLGTTGISGTLTITKTGTTARTATFPDAAITVAGINLAQTWSATQTFAAITAIGQVLFQDSTARQYGAVTGLTQISGSSAAASTLSIIRHSSAGNAPRLQLGISRGAAGTPTTVQSGDVLYQMEGIGADGTNYATVGVSCIGVVDAAVSTGVVPSAWVWNTMNSGGALAERMRISSAGILSLTNTTDATTTSDGSVRLSGGLSVAANKAIVAGGNIIMATATAASTTAGTIQRETNQDKHYAYANSIGGWLDKCIFSQYATVSQAGVVTDQSLASATARGTRTLPANFFKLGKVLRFRLCGRYTTDAAAGNATIQIKLGSTVFRTTGSIALDNSSTALPWEIEGEIVCQTTGGTGTVEGVAVWKHMISGATSNYDAENLGGTAAVTIDTTASQTFDVIWTASDAGTTLTCTCFRLWEVC